VKISTAINAVSVRSCFTALPPSLNLLRDPHHDVHGAVAAVGDVLEYDFAPGPQRHDKRDDLKRDPLFPEIRSIADLLSQELPPARWIVPDILPEGVTLLAGKPKIGKTWLAQGLAVAVATGGMGQS
jgi:hypothetical protein